MCLNANTLRNITSYNCAYAVINEIWVEFNWLPVTSILEWVAMKILIDGSASNDFSAGYYRQKIKARKYKRWEQDSRISTKTQKICS